jgi:Xaa-Pro aminopeptidase
MDQTALLLISESYHHADMYHAIHFLFGDPVIYVRTGQREVLVCSNFERGEAAAHSRVDNVLSFDDLDYSQLLATHPSRAQAFASLVQRLLEREHVDAVTVTDEIPLSMVDHLRASGITVLCQPDALVRERSIKHSDEIDALHTVQRANERAMQLAIDLIAASEDRGDALFLDGTPLTSERIRTAVEQHLLDVDCQAEALIIAGGSQGAAPHHRGTGVLRAEQTIVLDFFPRHRLSRFYADMTRTVSKGDPGPQLRQMYDTTLRAQELALTLIAPGANGREIYEAVCRLYEEAGYATTLRAGRYPPTGFIHSLGHGLGLDVHEQPGLNSRDQVLEVGHVVTVEPGLYDPAVGGVRIEDVAVVTEHGCSVITQFPKQLRV